LDQEKLERMFTASRFIVDDMHRRSLETDLVIERLISGVRQVKKEVPAHFVFMSATPDSNLVSYLSHAQVIEDKTPAPFKVVRELVLRDTVFDVTRLEAIKQTQRILKAWEAMIPDFPAAPGAIAVFLSGNVMCQKFVHKIRSLFDHIPLAGKRVIFPLFTDVRHNDEQEQFYGRLTQELTLLKAEREGDINKFGNPPLFFVPIFLTKHATASALQIITEKIPPTIKDLIVRIIITTGDSPTLAIPDLTVVIDTGIHEVQYYDLTRGIDYVQEEPIPEMYCNERAKLVGQTNDGLAILIGIKNAVRPKSEIPEVKRLDFSRSCLRLWRLNYRFSDLQNLPDEPQPQLMSDCKEQFRRYGILDERGVKTPFGDCVVKFSFFLPLFAASVVKFLEACGNDRNAALFACFIFYGIENSKELIAIPTATCFVNFFVRTPTWSHCTVLSKMCSPRR
jgi:HrpA-like RNA helicase